MTTTTMMMVMTSTAGNSSDGWRGANDNGTENRDQANNGITFARLIKRKKHTTLCHCCCRLKHQQVPVNMMFQSSQSKETPETDIPPRFPCCRKECHMWTNDSFPIISSVYFCWKHSPGGDNGLGRWKSRKGKRKRKHTRGWTDRRWWFGVKKLKGLTFSSVCVCFKSLKAFVRKYPALDRIGGN